MGQRPLYSSGPGEDEQKGRTLLIGFIIGAASGAAQFMMLSKFTNAVTGGALNIKAALFGISQFFLPLVVLLCCAMLLPDGLMWSGIGMAASLIICSLVKFIRSLKNGK